MNWAIYRIHYGLDFLKQSIDSIIDDVDKVFVIYSKDPWVVKDTVTYLGDTIPMPQLHENVPMFMNEHYLGNKKVDWLNNEYSTPRNQFRKMYDQVVHVERGHPGTVLFMEPDMVFKKGDVNDLRIQLHSSLPCVGTMQIELWKDHRYRVPQRNRIGPVMWAPEYMLGVNPNWSTGFGPTTVGHEIYSHNIQNYNFGFCLNATTMLYKHLTAIQFSAEIGDSIPSHQWYRDKWLNWTPKTRDIEISEAWKHLIPRAELYNMPDEMKKQMGIS